MIMCIALPLVASLKMNLWKWMKINPAWCYTVHLNVYSSAGTGSSSTTSAALSSIGSNSTAGADSSMIEGISSTGDSGASTTGSLTDSSSVTDSSTGAGLSSTGAVLSSTTASSPLFNSSVCWRASSASSLAWLANAASSSFICEKIKLISSLQGIEGEGQGRLKISNYLPWPIEPALPILLPRL